MKTQRSKEYIDRYTQPGTGKQMPDLQHSDPGACAATPAPQPTSAATAATERKPATAASASLTCMSSKLSEEHRGSARRQRTTDRSPKRKDPGSDPRSNIRSLPPPQQQLLDYNVPGGETSPHGSVFTNGWWALLPASQRLRSSKREPFVGRPWPTRLLWFGQREGRGRSL
jgi:hypothetical protein